MMTPAPAKPRTVGDVWNEQRANAFALALDWGLIQRRTCPNCGGRGCYNDGEWQACEDCEGSGLTFQRREDGEWVNFNWEA